MLKLDDESPPAAPAEDSELPAEVQRELLELSSRPEATLYQVLGLEASADVLAIRSAYLLRSRRYHPDTYFRKRLGGLGPLLAESFRRVSEAHAVLSDAESRAAYDADHLGKMSAPERAAVAERVQGRADEDRRAQERRRRLFHTKGFARIGAARSLFEQAQAHAEQGERGLAVQALKAARELDPGRKEIAARLVELETEGAKARAHTVIAQGREQEAAGDVQAALAAYQMAIRFDPGSAAAHLGAARVAFTTRDAAGAASWAARAVEYAPRAAEARLILAKAQISLGHKAKAKATLAALLEQHSDHKEARALLKSL